MKSIKKQLKRFTNFYVGSMLRNKLMYSTGFIPLNFD